MLEFFNFTILILPFTFILIAKFIMLILRSISQTCGYTWLQPLGSKFQFHLPLKSHSFRHFLSAPAQLRANLLPSGATDRSCSSSKNKSVIIAPVQTTTLVNQGRHHPTPVPDWKREIIEDVKTTNRSSDDYNPRRKWSEGTILHLTLQADLLRQLMKAQSCAPSISWVSIAKELHRSPAQCQSKWKTLQYKPQGPFTEEEDALILRTVENWEQVKGKGLWTSLGERLQRDHRIVRSRYRALLVPESEHKKKKAIIRWNDEMNAALAEARVDPLDVSWQDVAARLNELGYEVTGDDCRWHWFHYLQGVSTGQRSHVEWTPEEVAQLQQLRNHDALNWKEIGQTMHILPRACYDKFKSMSLQHLKRGPYSVDEDECILQAVKEWGDPRARRGLWSELQKKMHRPAQNLRARWRHLIANSQIVDK